MLFDLNVSDIFEYCLIHSLTITIYAIQRILTCDWDEAKLKIKQNQIDMNSKEKFFFDGMWNNGYKTIHVTTHYNVIYSSINHR